MFISFQFRSWIKYSLRIKSKLLVELENFLTLKKNRKKFGQFIFFFCFNPDVNQARQRRLFSGNLPAMFIIFLGRTIKKSEVIATSFSRFSFVIQ